jgi:hypothetical protein
VPDCNSQPPDRKQFIQSSTSRPSNSFNIKPSVSKPSHGNKSKDPTCYSCGQVGRYLSDPQCPNFGQRRMGAIQEDHDHKAVVDQPVDSADTGDPEPEPIADKAEGATHDVELEPEPLDHGIDEYPLVGLQYTLEGKDYQLEMYEQYSDDGEQMMVIREDQLHDDANGTFPVVIEDSDTEVSEPDDNEVIEQRIQSIHIQQDAGHPAKQTTTVVHRSSASMTHLKWPASQIRPLVAKMTINGLDAVVMFDTGSTSDAVSPEFA